MYSLSIKDFQRYKQATMEIKGFTVLEGPSNLGKSSIGRALGVVTQNNWQSSFVAKGAKNTIIELKADDIEIKATKGSSNEFNIVKDGEQFDYKKAGKDIPKEIIASGFSPLVIGKDKINILMAEQYDPLFMVAYSDQQNTKILNSVFDVDVIERANELVIKDLAGQKRELKRELQFKEDKEKELDEVNILLERMKVLREVYDKIDLIDSFKDCSKEYEETENRLKASEDTILKIDKLIALNTAYTKATELQNKLKEYQSLSNSLKQLEIKLSKLLPIRENLNSLTRLKEATNNLNDVTLDIQDVTFEIERTDEALKCLSKLNLITSYRSKEVKIENSSHRLSSLNNIEKLIQMYNTLLTLEKLPFVKWKIEGKNEGLSTVVKDIEILDDEMRSIGRCPCCKGKIH